jgi:hypothetical protein
LESITNYYLNNTKLIAKEIDESLDLTLEYEQETSEIKIENENNNKSDKHINNQKKYSLK